MTEGKQTRATTEKRSSWKTGNVSSVIIDQAPLQETQETEYQKGAREHFERLDQAEADKKAAADKKVVPTEQPQPAPLPYTMKDAARLIMAATESMEPAERGIFVELLSNGK